MEAAYCGWRRAKSDSGSMQEKGKKVEKAARRRFGEHYRELG
jgi:hypothetical protein